MSYKFENVYEPEEDSKLLLRHVCSELKSKILSDKNKVLNVCEIGVGSGFVLSNVSKEFSNFNYFGSDINPDAISLTQSEFDELGKAVILKNSSLFSGFDSSTKFDCVFFNTPYFPFEDSDDSLEKLSFKERAIYGGKYGYEVLEDFVLSVNDYLNPKAICLMVFSSLTDLSYIEKLLDKNLFSHIILEEENSFFEKIYCLKFWRNDVLEEVCSLGVSSIKYLASGKHSMVLDGFYDSISVIIKTGLAQHLSKEGFFEEKMKDEDFVPEMFFSGDKYVVREKVLGDRIIDFFQKCDSKSLVIVLDRILQITQRMDELNINKFEMTNPYKHIYVDSSLKVMFIDFERCIFSETPKNTTQVLQYFRRNMPLFEEYGLKLSEDKIMSISKKYKSDNFKFGVKDLIK